MVLFFGNDLNRGASGLITANLNNVDVTNNAIANSFQLGGILFINGGFNKENADSAAIVADIENSNISNNNFSLTFTGMLDNGGIAAQNWDAIGFIHINGENLKIDNNHASVEGLTAGILLSQRTEGGSITATIKSATITNNDEGVIVQGGFSNVLASIDQSIITGNLFEALQVYTGGVINILNPVVFDGDIFADVNSVITFPDVGPFTDTIANTHVTCADNKCVIVP